LAMRVRHDDPSTMLSALAYAGSLWNLQQLGGVNYCFDPDRAVPLYVQSVSNPIFVAVRSWSFNVSEDMFDVPSYCTCPHL
jgi:hypothetical protein